MHKNIKVKKCTSEHVCGLPSEDDIVVHYIDSGWFVELRRRLKNLFMVNEDHPMSKDFLKSRAAIRQEKARHLHHYYYMIHPFSTARTYWEFFMMFVFFLLLIIIPIEVAVIHVIWEIKIPKLILDVICCIDICITFFTGYYQHHTKKIILDKKRVAKNYIFGYFIIDFISSFPIELIVFFIGFGDFWFFRMLNYLKIIRIATLIKYLDRFRDWKEYSIYMFKIIKLIIIYLIILLWVTSIIQLLTGRKHTNHLIPNYFKHHIIYGLIFCIFKSVYMLLLVGYGDEPVTNNLVTLLEMTCLTIGIIMYLYMLAQILQILNKYNSSRNKYQQLMQQIQEYMRYKELPESMRARIYEYFDFRFQKHYYKANEILSTISTQMRQEILLHSCKRLVEKVEFFRNLPTSLLLRIVTCLKSEIFLPNDVIVQSGTVGDSMYFISSGTVAIYTTQGKELCHLSDGAHFGEIALVMHREQRVASVVAVDCCELFNLSRGDFHKAIEPYPELLHRITKLAQDRLHSVMKSMRGDPEGALSDIEDIDDDDDDDENNAHF